MSEGIKKKATLNLNSRSFKPKSFKPKATPEKQNQASSSNPNLGHNNNQNSRKGTMKSENSDYAQNTKPSISPPILSNMPNPALNMLQFSNVLGGGASQIPNIGGLPLKQFQGNTMSPQIPSFGPSKPPPLLFMPPENLMNSHVQLAPAEPKKLKLKSYTAEFIMSFREKYKKRPAGMKELDFPHKSKSLKMTYIEDSAINPFNKKQQKQFDYNLKVLKLREWLNKLSNKNYSKISKYILTKFQYNPQLLKELSKVIFIKATTETNFIKIYVNLAEQLFKKFNDKENVEMNFKKLLLKKCQKEFYKDKMSDCEEDFSKGSLLVYDKEEITYKTKQKVFGNLKLIGELFCRGYVTDKVIMECIEFLFSHITDESIESLCQIMIQVTKYILFDKKRERIMQKHINNPDKTLIKYDWINTKLEELMNQYTNNELSSRIRFKIQDVIDEYQKSWENRVKTLMGVHFESRTQIHSDEALTLKIPNRLSPQKNELKGQAKVLSGIGSAFGISVADEDEDCKREVNRKVSVNENNVVGLNFQRYQDAKPSKLIRRKIFNFVDEYNSTEEDKETALQNMQDTMKQNDLEGYFFVGYALQYSFSMNQEGFERVFNLLIEFHEHGYLENDDLVEGLNVSVSNFADTLIDYPETKTHVEHILMKLHDLELISTRSKDKYIEHIKKIENDEYDY